MKRYLSLGFAAMSFLTLAGCVTHTRIGRIMYDPYRYQRRDVEIRGVVTGAVNGVVAGGYQIDDGTGRIIVISNGGPPRKGTEVVVRGRVQPGLTVLGKSFAITIRERDRHIPGGYYPNGYRDHRP